MYPFDYSEQNKPNLGGVDLPADDSNWLSAKFFLNQTAKGRQIVSYTEQHINTNSNNSIIQPSLSRRMTVKAWHELT
jgi:hypothetical protein